MNYILHLNAFFERIASDERITPTHISLYMALFQVWNTNRFRIPFSISRQAMMRSGKIHAKATYHKVIKELDKFGYIMYKPSYDPFRGSAIYMTALQAGKENDLPETGTSTVYAKDRYPPVAEQPPVQKMTPNTNHTNILNHKTTYEPVHENTCSDNSGVSEEKKASDYPQQRKKNNTGGAALPLPSSPEEVHVFFTLHDSTSHEAQKFFNYFQSNGWKVGGRTPMKDWQAAARNWILNQNKYTPRVTHHAGNLHVTTEKNYAEPL